MKTWQGLYAMVWIAFVEFLLILTPTTTRMPFVVAHIGVGVAIVALALVNFSNVRGSRVPGRVKRTAKATVQLSVLMGILGGILGVLLALNLEDAMALPIIGFTAFDVINFLHVVNAFAIITQAAAVAIAYDMWEEREFQQETEPGVVPPNPAMQAAAKKA